MTKMISLLASAYVGGVLCHPHDGALPADDSDFERLVNVEKKAADVTADFAGEEVPPPTPLEKEPAEEIDVDVDLDPDAEEVPAATAPRKKSTAKKPADAEKE